VLVDGTGVSVGVAVGIGVSVTAGVSVAGGLGVLVAVAVGCTWARKPGPQASEVAASVRPRVKSLNRAKIIKRIPLKLSNRTIQRKIIPK
jgi:hypothetical protein